MPPAASRADQSTSFTTTQHSLPRLNHHHRSTDFVCQYFPCHIFIWWSCLDLPCPETGLKQSCTKPWLGTGLFLEQPRTPHAMPAVYAQQVSRER